MLDLKQLSSTEQLLALLHSETTCTFSLASS